ncbi:ferritin-like domain-containing protein [Hufsiella ginkgonis]|uniref:Iminophenyl-pyruvate dimer synthase domain-containing protein n=1 Tax=Hufsiella ginkgonis TaxID=2695274 RepID=A0A7K1XSN7_9SPHI|nr:ferritin-like domain-containing protein [Hufsiella ginkgonis]MXV13887.1 hypothetical protein [Hufsiella ginkgonis]
MLQAQKPITDRPLSFVETDKSALNAIAQASVNVELFTIPLYMTSLYSIYGTHQVNGQNDFYEGRLWPGMSTSVIRKKDPADPDPDARKNLTPYDTQGNKEAFNGIFSVFIAEMLHLQLASNLCNAIGVKPTYTGAPLQNENFGWDCYAGSSVIPHILDFQDCKPWEQIKAEREKKGDDKKHIPIDYRAIKVMLGPVDQNQVDLFLAIEETEEDAHEILIDPDKYFPTVPFANWTAKSKAADLPMFGSIGYMYLCLFTYLSIEYTDGQTLWDKVFKAKSLQQDLFNTDTDTHKPEYPLMSATIDANEAAAALTQAIDMIDGITDQGEGKGVVPVIRQIAHQMLLNKKAKLQNAANSETNDHGKLDEAIARLAALTAVAHQYQPNADNLEKDYPSYNDKGIQQKQSRDAYARVSFGSVDHYATFAKVRELLLDGQIKTWADWHADPQNVWTASMLKTKDHVADKYPIPSAQDVAGALNNLKQKDPDKNYQMLSHVVAGAIKGVTSVLNDYFNKPGTSFPFPSMSGSGDRMALCWAVFGKAPALSIGVESKVSGLLYHACQGLSLDPNNPGKPNSCAPVAVFHTCKGSNTCAAEGGCGFVQSVQGGGSCGGGGSSCTSSGKPSPKGIASKHAMLNATKGHALHGAAPNIPNPFTKPRSPAYYSAPSDNRCMSYGGCAVPISASQIFPAPDSTDPEQPGQMELYNFLGSQFQPMPVNTMSYQAGDLVYDVAWNAYIAVLQERNRPIPPKPKPSDIRLAFPPST